MNPLSRIIALALAFSFLVACSTSPRQRAIALFDDVESFINERPDSALTVLQGVDSSTLFTPALRARYSLLRTMAQDKCYLDISNPDLLSPADHYFEHHGSADEKLKALYYQGRIAQSNKDQNKAVIFFSKAESFADKAQDTHAVGLLYEAMASAYDVVYNLDKQQEYVEKALAVYKNAQDPIYDSFLGDLAIVYFTRKDWAKADSLFQHAISHSEAYPFALTIYLSNYARMKVLQPGKDPDGTISLLDRKRKLSGSLSAQEAGAYAYALALTGRQTAADALRARLESFDGLNRYDALPWLVRMSALKGDYETAYRLQAESHISERSLIIETLEDSVTQALQDYYAEASQSERERRLRLEVIALSVIALLLVLAILQLSRSLRMRVELNRLLSIRAELEQELHIQKARTDSISDVSAARLEQLRYQLHQERLDRLQKHGRYGYMVWMEQKGRSSNARIIQTLRKDLREVCAFERDTHALDLRLDKDLDDIFSHLKRDLGISGRTDEERFLCYWLIDLKPDMIAELLGMTTNNVYVKAHRLENRIRELDKPEYAFLLHLKSYKG